MFKRIPEEMHPQVNLVLRNSFVLTVETIARYESTYLVFRGREGGTSDEGRAFFVPYEEISYIRIERIVRLGELKRMYGETGHLDSEDRLAASEAAASKEVATTSIDSATPPPIPAPVAGTDPASIAKQNLLDRIRAARANANAGGGSAKVGAGAK
jgi:hypothetical protein